MSRIARKSFHTILFISIVLFTGQAKALVYEETLKDSFSFSEGITISEYASIYGTTYRVQNNGPYSLSAFAVSTNDYIGPSDGWTDYSFLFHQYEESTWNVANVDNGLGVVNLLNTFGSFKSLFGNDRYANFYYSDPMVDNLLEPGDSMTAYASSSPLSEAAVLIFNRTNGDIRTASSNSVPEPTTIALMSLGFVGIGYAGRRKSAQA